MLLTLHFRGETTAHAVEYELELGGDPLGAGVAPDRLGTWSGRFRRRDDGSWMFDLGAGSTPATTLNGEPIIGTHVHDLELGDVIAAGELAISVGYTVPELAPAEPLSTLERDLLVAIARDPDDDTPRRVLADLWQEGLDEARGTLVHAQCEGLDVAHQLLLAHAAIWCEPAVQAGFLPANLDFERGFVPPLVLAPREPLARSPAAWRLSPVHYHLGRHLLAGETTAVHEATRVTATGPTDHVAIKLATFNHPEARYAITREIAILGRIDSPHVTRVRDAALSRSGPALAMPWAGTRLEALLAAARRAQRPPPTEAVVLGIGIQLCRALAAVHAANVTHTEVTPDHVLIDPCGHVTLCDLGFASCDLRRPQQPSEPRRVRGRFRYMSPEQVRGLALGPPTDVFALALLLAELVQGFHPIRRAQNDFDILVAIRDLDFRLPETGSGLGGKLRALLVREPEARTPAALLGLELARIAEAAHLRVGPETVADFARASGG